MGHESIRVKVNGEEHEVAFARYKTLLEILREDLNLPGTKHGCELGECGACAVLLDGAPVLSCLVAAVECGGREVVTVEGLEGRDGGLHPVQAARDAAPNDTDLITSPTASACRMCHDSYLVESHIGQNGGVIDGWRAEAVSD